ncbi:MAG: hypothetical protein KDI81_04960, partial [Xanthomonadales bacterium]|nr:hypothetical protein [Xanthomonadales bacterium]
MNRALLHLAVCLLALLSACAGATGSDRAAGRGYVVPIGGALDYDNTAVWSRLVALAGGRSARFAV